MYEYGTCHSGNPEPDWCCMACTNSPTSFCPEPEPDDTTKTFCTDGSGNPDRKFCIYDGYFSNEGAWAWTAEHGECYAPQDCYDDWLFIVFTCNPSNGVRDPWAEFTYHWAMSCHGTCTENDYTGTSSGSREYVEVFRFGWSAYICGPPVNLNGPGGTAEEGWTGGTDPNPDDPYYGTDKLHGNGISYKHAMRRKKTPGRTTGCAPAGSGSSTPSYGNSFDENEGVIGCGVTPGIGMLPVHDFDEIFPLEFVGPGKGWQYRLNEVIETEGPTPCSPGAGPGSFRFSIHPGSGCGPMWDLPEYQGFTEANPETGEAFPLCKGYRASGEIEGDCAQVGAQCLSWDIYDTECPGARICNPELPYTWTGSAGDVRCNTKNPTWGGAVNCRGDKGYAKINWNPTDGVPRLHDYLDAKDGSYGGDGGDLYQPSDTPGLVDHIPWSTCPCETSLDPDELPDGICSYQEGESCDNLLCNATWCTGHAPC